MAACFGQRGNFEFPAEVYGDITRTLQHGLIGVPVACSDALLMAIKWKCLSTGVYLRRHCASTTRLSVNLIMSTSDVSVIGGIVKLQNSGCTNVNSFLAARQQRT